MNSRANNVFCMGGADKLLTNLHVFATSMNKVRTVKSIEAVHDLRVYSRRLRIGLSVYRNCYPKKKLAEWKPELRRMTKRFGNARDLDVQILYLKKTIAKLNKKDLICKPGISKILVRYQQDRERQQKKLLSAIDRLNRKKILASMQIKSEKIAKASVSRTKKYSPIIYTQAYRQIRSRLKKMLAYKKYVNRSRDVTNLHQMRITAKHLRYTMEYFEPIFNGELRIYIQKVREIQKLLGEFHDCVVWIQYFSDISNEKSMQTAKIKPGIDYLLADQKKRRKDIYRQFRRCWDETIRENTWENLKKMLKNKS
jgi:CHAD domain-containing protein